MHQRLRAVLCLAVVWLCASIGPGAVPSSTRLSPSHVAAIARVARVWGFLKYHHPVITGGHRDWDAYLLSALPDVLQDADAADAILRAWAADPGEAPPCGPCATVPSDAAFMSDLAWIDDEALDEDVRAWLKQVHANRRRGSAQAYVFLQPGVLNPNFSGEARYTGITHPVAELRLMALFRYWNIVQYWSPYRDLVQDRWNAVLHEFIPRFLAADDPAAFRLELAALTSRLEDGHGGLIGPAQALPPGGSCLLPIHVRFVEGRAVVDAYTHAEAGPASGLRIGDVIQRLDATPVSTLLRRWSPYYAASNEPARLLRMMGSLTLGACSEVTVHAWRPGGAFRLKATRLHFSQLDFTSVQNHELPGEPFQLLSEDVAYLKISTTRVADVRDYILAAQNTRGLIIDIRSYPSQFLVFQLGQYLVDVTGSFASFNHGDLANPGTFHWLPGPALRPVFPRYWGKVVILVDETTISSAEYHAMAFRKAPGAIVVGSTTAGADGNVSEVPLIGGWRTFISGIGVFYPDHTPTQQVGIVPDVKVLPTIRGIREGRDEVLEEAIRQIQGSGDEDGLRVRNGSGSRLTPR
ncbi:MAG: S41 family peptidase [Candidatus Polarisedimenticolia bacterium]